MGADVVLGEEGRFQRFGEVVEGGAGVAELSGAASSWWGEGCGAEEGVGGAAGIVARVAVKDAVSLAEVLAGKRMTMVWGGRGEQALTRLA